MAQKFPRETAPEGEITQEQVVQLGRSISPGDMESIALEHLGFEPETLAIVKTDHPNRAEAFNREILRRWMYRNPGGDQRQKLATLLYQAARNSYIDARKVRHILGVTEEGATESAKETVTLEDVESLAEDLKPYTEEAMKIEVAPWIKDYVVDMDKLYTPSTIEKLDNQPTGSEGIPLKDYKELFKVKVKSKEDSQKRKAKKILIKGDPGIGKTTLVKKIAWDWAKGLFTSISIVLVVFLRLARLGDAIENVIVWQNPVLKGLKVSPQKVLNILDKFGRNCLLILDGLDEYASGRQYNDDVYEIIRGEKLLHCNVILTSRPHSTRPIEKYFGDVVRVEGFKRSQAEIFCNKILTSKMQIRAVLDFNPSKKKSFGKVHKNPILLSFLCLLVREDDIDLSDHRISTGEIYGRLVRCLYKKFCIRQQEEYRVIQLCGVLKSMGKMALETLTSGDPLLQRSRVVKEVGAQAFDYGLLIGHEDFRLIRDETADIFITFPHRSIQEFLGAFYFIQKLNDGASVEELLGADCEEPIFLMNPLFLEFCCWFLFGSQLILDLGKMNQAEESVINAVLERINFAQINLADIGQCYPALNIKSGIEKIVLAEYWTKLLPKCCMTKNLFIPYEKLFGYKLASFVLQSLGPVLKQLTSITFAESELHYVAAPVNPSEIHVVFSSYIVPAEEVVDLLKLCQKSGKKVCLYLNGPSTAEWEASELLNQQVKRLQFINGLPTFTQGIKCCPDLTHLSVSFTLSVHLLGLYGALKQGNLPALRHFSFKRVYPTTGVIRLLFHFFSPSDHLCTKLQSLELVDFTSEETQEAGIFTHSWPNLTDLSLSEQNVRYIVEILTPETFPVLTCLSLKSCIKSTKDLQSLATRLQKFNIEQLNIEGSRNTRGKFTQLSQLLSCNFLSLRSLNIKDCWLDSEALMSLAKAKVDGRLPELSIWIYARTT